MGKQASLLISNIHYTNSNDNYFGQIYLNGSEHETYQDLADGGLVPAFEFIRGGEVTLTVRREAGEGATYMDDFRVLETKQNCEESDLVFKQDFEKLNILWPDTVVKATSQIDAYIQVIQTLLEKGYAYVSGGNVYFDTSKLEDYYKLTNHKEDDMVVGVREGVEYDEAKRNQAAYGFRSIGFANRLVPFVGRVGGWPHSERLRAG